MNAIEAPVSYDSLIETFATIVFAQACGYYQGDIVYGLRDPHGQSGIVLVGYGSCSGCDALEAIRGWDDEISEGKLREYTELRDSLAASTCWGTDALLDRDWEGATWGMYDSEVRAALYDALEAVGLRPPFERAKDD